jgi:hypothetical protein
MVVRRLETSEPDIITSAPGRASGAMWSVRPAVGFDEDTLLLMVNHLSELLDLKQNI